MKIEKVGLIRMAGMRYRHTVKGIFLPLGFLGFVVSFGALFLGWCTYRFIHVSPSYEILFLIFVGTLTVYNLDHLSDLNADRVTNPLRYRFIMSNLGKVFLLTRVSVLLSFVLVVEVGVGKILFLFPVFLFGIFHNKLKGNTFFSASYITISWIVVVIIFPATINGKFWESLPMGCVVGTALFANAYACGLREGQAAHTTIPKVPILVAISGVILGLLFSRLKQLIAIPAVTAATLFLFEEDELFETMYLDGALLAASVFTLFVIH